MNNQQYHKYDGTLAALVNERRKPDSQIMITRLFFAVLLKEGQTSEGETEIKKLIQELNMEINAQITANQRMSSGVSEDKSITGFTLINGPVIISLLESNRQKTQVHPNTFKRFWSSWTSWPNTLTLCMKKSKYWESMKKILIGNNWITKAISMLGLWKTQRCRTHCQWSR